MTFLSWLFAEILKIVRAHNEAISFFAFASVVTFVALRQFPFHSPLLLLRNDQNQETIDSLKIEIFFKNVVDRQSGISARKSNLLGTSHLPERIWR